MGILHAAPSRLPRPTRSAVAVTLALLMLFFGIALFSPLHRHTPGKANSCSFNDIERQWVSLAEIAVIVQPMIVWIEKAAEAAEIAPVTRTVADSRDRAPPALS